MKKLGFAVLGFCAEFLDDIHKVYNQLAKEGEEVWKIRKEVSAEYQRRKAAKTT